MAIDDNPLGLKLFLQNGVPDWEGALCAEEGMDPETWFLDDPMSDKIAKSFCFLCPYGPGPDGNDQCFEQALKEEEQVGYFAYGIRGGRDAAYRQDILDRKRRRKLQGFQEVADVDGLHYM